MPDENNSHFDTATDTVTDLINIKREGNMLQDAMLPSCVLSGAQNRSLCQWQVVHCDQVIFCNVSYVFSKSRQRLSEKT